MSFTNKVVVIACFLVLLVPLISLSTYAYDVVVFEQYDTSYYLQSGKLIVEKDLILQNTGNNPIIPGELHFKLYQQDGDKIEPAKITELVATSNANDLTARVDSFDDYSDLVVHVWNPLLPGFNFPISISYEMDFRPKGILFHELAFPIEETTIPVQESSTSLMLPKQYKVTYAPSAEITEDNAYRVVNWNDDEEFAIEYTVLPLPRVPFRMVSVFWLIVLLILGTVFIFLNMKRPNSKHKK